MEGGRQARHNRKPRSHNEADTAIDQARGEREAGGRRECDDVYRLRNAVGAGNHGGPVHRKQNQSKQRFCDHERASERETSSYYSLAHSFFKLASQAGSLNLGI